jgi:subtilisin family serine protease
VLLRALAAVVVLAAGVTTGGARAVTPSDPLVTSWAYAAANLPAAWDVTTGSETVSIAIVDSGVQATHPDLAGGVDPGYDFVDLDTDAADLVGHGTAVAGIAAARANNGLGAAGACWTCRILPLRVLGPEGFARFASMAAAVDEAVARGAAVVNLSLYGEGRNGALEASIRRARAAGVVVVAAAGNEGTTTPQYPAAYSDVLGVAATDENGGLAVYSSRGVWVKLAAPGFMPTTQLGGGFGAGCGTSGAAPVVAGIVGLMRAQAPFASVAQIEAALAEGAVPVGGVRSGRVDALAALRRLGRPGPALQPTVEGTPLPGQVLTAYSGVWSGAGLDVSYRWARCRSECEPAGVGRTYTVPRGDGGARLRVTLSAPGVSDALSDATSTVPTPPRNLSAPTIAGRPLVGAKLTGARGRWTGGTPLSFAYRWDRCRDGACTARTVVARTRGYRVRGADRGRRLRLTVVAANTVGSAIAASALTRPVR